MAQYYLNNLCNDQQFPQWPVDQPLLLLRDTVERWRIEMAKGIPDKDITEAKRVLQMDAKKMDGTACARRTAISRGGTIPTATLRAGTCLKRCDGVRAAVLGGDAGFGHRPLQCAAAHKDAEPCLRSLPRNGGGSEVPGIQPAPTRGHLAYLSGEASGYRREGGPQAPSTSSARSMGFGRSGASRPTVGANGASVYLLYECAMLLYHTCAVSLSIRESWCAQAACSVCTACCASVWRG